MPVSERINLKCIKTFDVQFFSCTSLSSSYSGSGRTTRDCHNAIASTSETFPQLRTKTQQTKNVHITWRRFEDEEKGNRYTITWYSAIQCFSSFRLLYNNKNKKKSHTHIITLSPRMETHVVSRYSNHIPRNDEYVCGCCSSINWTNKYNKKLGNIVFCKLEDVTFQFFCTHIHFQQLNTVVYDSEQHYKHRGKWFFSIFFFFWICKNLILLWHLFKKHFFHMHQLGQLISFSPLFPFSNFGVLRNC